MVGIYAYILHTTTLRPVKSQKRMIYALSSVCLISRNLAVTRFLAMMNWRDSELDNSLGRNTQTHGTIGRAWRSVRLTGES